MRGLAEVSHIAVAGAGEPERIFKVTRATSASPPHRAASSATDKLVQRPARGTDAPNALTPASV